VEKEPGQRAYRATVGLCSFSTTKKPYLTTRALSGRILFNQILATEFHIPQIRSNYSQ
jgi:hypothetical protein